MTRSNGTRQAWQRPMSIASALPTLLAISLLMFSTSIAHGATMVVKLGDSTSERLEDRDGDGLAEFLVLEVQIEVFEPGSYGLHGSTLDGEVTSNAGPLDLPMGSNKVELGFSGAGIARYHEGGRLEFELEVFPRDPSASPALGSYTTKAEYSPDRFEAPSAGTGVEVSILGSEVLIESKVLSLAINTTMPKLTFSYSGDVGASTRSSVTYLSVIAYDDSNGNGRFDSGSDTGKYDAQLDLVDWDLRTDFSQGYEISLHGVVPLRLSGSATAVAWAKMTFSYRSRALILDGVAQKFDIDIELWQPLDASHIAVVHELRDLSGKRTVAEGEGGSVQTDDPNILRLVSGKGLTSGIYSWSDDIMVGVDAPDKASSAHTSYALEGDMASVVFSYPLSGGTLSVHHDPVIGMDPENMPVSSDQPGFLSNRPLAMLMGTVIGTLIVVGTVLYRSLSEGGPKGPRGDKGRRGGD